MWPSSVSFYNVRVRQRRSHIEPSIFGWMRISIDRRDACASFDTSMVNVYIHEVPEGYARFGA